MPANWRLGGHAIGGLESMPSAMRQRCGLAIGGLEGHTFFSSSYALE